MSKDPIDKEQFWKILGIVGILGSIILSVAIYHQQHRDDAQDEGLTITREWMDKHEEWAQTAREANLKAKAEGQERYLNDRNQQIEILTGLQKDLEHHEKDHDK